MDLTLSPELEMLAESARGFAARACPTEQVRSIAARPTGFDAELWSAMCELGWAGLTIEEGDGGAGAGLLALVVLAESLGSGPVPSPLSTTATLAAGPIAAAGTPTQRERWLPALASGTAIGTMANLEPGSGDECDPARMPGAPMLVGTKLLVPWAAVADVLLVTTSDGIWLVEPTRGGVEIVRHDDLGADPVFEVRLDGAAAERLGGDDGPDQVSMLARTFDAAGIAELAVVLGCAQRALDLAIGHATDRHQFGRPIGSFQAVAHHCVDILTDLDACRFLTYRAATVIDNGEPAELEVAAALAYGKEAMRRIFVHAHQVHGAIGFSTEHDLHLFTRRAKAFELGHGSTARHLGRVADAMGLQT